MAAGTYRRYMPRKLGSNSAVLKDLFVPTGTIQMSYRKTYLVFKENQKLRKILTGPRYGITHHKLLVLGLGGKASNPYLGVDIFLSLSVPRLM